MYYLLGRSREPGRWIDDFPYYEDVDWSFGRSISVPVPDPLECTLKRLNPQSSDHSPHMPAYFVAEAPLFRDDFVEALRAFGVGNIDTYDISITDPDNGQIHTNYKAVNIIGLIAAADMAKSDATVHGDGPPLIDVDFDNLVLDESKIPKGMQIFRLAESTNAIMVHEKLRDFLIKRGFGDDLIFYDPSEVAL